MNSIKISVIIAIYNVEKYLEKCINSVISQTYSNLEIVLVDDGSSDRSGYICDKYLKIDKRIKVIHKKNGGSLSARKIGIKNSTGAYLSIIDGDDWIENDMYEKMVSAMGTLEPDCLVTGYCEDRGEEYTLKSNIIESGLYVDKGLEQLFDKALFSYDSFYEPGIIPAYWNKLLKKENVEIVIKDVPHDVRMGEDAIVTYATLAIANKILICNEIISYHYRVIPDSMSRNIDCFYFAHSSNLIHSLKSFFEKNNRTLLKQLDYYNLFITWIGIEQILSKKNRVSLYDKIKSLKEIEGYMDIKKAWSAVDDTFFSDVEKRAFAYLSDDKIFRLMILVYKEKLINKLSNTNH